MNTVELAESRAFSELSGENFPYWYYDEVTKRYRHKIEHPWHYRFFDVAHRKMGSMRVTLSTIEALRSAQKDSAGLFVSAICCRTDRGMWPLSQFVIREPALILWIDESRSTRVNFVKEELDQNVWTPWLTRSKKKG